MAPLPTDATEELADSSRYIRTFASDMAKVSGKASTPAPVPTPPTPKATQPKTETNDGVTTAEVDESLITQDSFNKSEQPLNLDTPSEGDSVSVFEQQVPVSPPQPQQVSLAPNLSSDREAVLARLKARASGVPPQPVVTPSLPQEVPPPPTESLIPTAPASTPLLEPRKTFADTFTAPRINYREPLPEIPATPPTPAPQMAPPTLPQVPANEVPERFHSYTTDFAGQFDTKKASTFSVLAAEADSGRKPVTRIASRRSSQSQLSVIVISVLLVVLGAGGVFGAWMYFTNSTPDITPVVSVTSLISYDEKKELTGRTGQELMTELADLSSEPLVSGNVLVAYISTASTTTKGLPFSTPAPGGDLIKALPLLAPDILMRNIEKTSVVGIIQSGSETRPFFVLKVASYERTFRGMLSYEPSMRQALGRLYPPYAKVEVDTGTVGTSTPAVQSPSFSILLEPTGFVDAVVRNYDVRILRDSQGRSILLYGYKDKETLIIARDETAFIDIVTRLNAKK